MQYNKLDESAKGVYIISATPFKDNGALDIESTKKLMDFYIEKGVDGITVLGVMGEAPNIYNKTEVNNLLDLKRSISDSYTKTEIDTNLLLKRDSHQNINRKKLKQEIL